MNIFEAIIQYPFLQNAYLVGMMLAFISPLYGVFVVAKKANLIPDTIGHVGLAASAFTVFFISLGILPPQTSPFYFTLIFAIVAAMVISYIGERFGNAKEISLAFVMTFSLGIAIILFHLSTIKTDISGYLFGSIIGLEMFDVVSVAIISILAILFICIVYRQLLFVTFDITLAKTRGIKGKQINMFFFVVLALIIASSIKFVGVLLISALMSLPVMIAITFTRSFKQTLIVSIAVSEFAMIVGLISSYYLQLPTSGAVAVLLGSCFLVVLIIRNIPRLYKKREKEEVA